MRRKKELLLSFQGLESDDGANNSITRFRFERTPGDFQQIGQPGPDCPWFEFTHPQFDLDNVDADTIDNALRR